MVSHEGEMQGPQHVLSDLIPVHRLASLSWFTTADPCIGHLLHPTMLYFPLPRSILLPSHFINFRFHFFKHYG